MTARRCLATLLAPALILVIAGPAPAQKKNPAGAAVLILSGGQREHHGYREQALYLASLLEDTGRFRVTISEDAAVLEAPSLARYDALILTADRRDPEFKLSEAQQTALVEFVRSGKGYVSIHGADNAAPDWSPEFRDLLGGVFSHKGLPDGKVRKGRYRVRIADTAHPVAKGLEDFDLDDELYYHLQMQPGVVPIATVAFEGTDWPVAWTRTFGKGRVFHTPLGHRDFGPEKPDPLRNPSLARLILQGLDWSVAK